MGMKKKEINYQLLIRRICLIVLDIICIIAASILALLTRFEFDFSQIPKEFLKVIYKYGPFTIVITLIIFSLFRIYSSLWEYAGIEEVFSLIAACLAAAVAKLYAQKGSKIVSVNYDGKEIRVFKKDVVMMDKKEDKIYYRRMDRKKEQMYVCDVDGGMEKMVGSEAGKD